MRLADWEYKISLLPNTTQPFGAPTAQGFLEREGGGGTMN